MPYNGDSYCENGGKKVLLKEIVEGKRYAFYKEAADWKDAIKRAAPPWWQQTVPQRNMRSAL